MPTPFPGMDPYLEVNPRWELFHAWFVRELARATLPRARDLDCWIDVERAVYQKEPSGEITLLGTPDDAVWPDAGSWTAAPSTSATATVPLTVPNAVHEIVLDPDALEQYKQDYLVVRESGEWRRILAVVELLSPANKAGTYMPRYREKRLRMLASRAHFMEIDLLRYGDNSSRAHFPELAPAPYFIFVARKTGVGRNEEGFPLRLQEPLPTIGLPIGPPRPDLPLNLEEALQTAYDLSVPPNTFRYDQPPEPPLTAADTAWAEQWLRDKHMR